MINFLKKLFAKEQLDYSDLLQRGAMVIDVRSPFEYATGHVRGSQNIPLRDIQNHILKIKKRNKPVITCCRSGARSGSAASTLNNLGIEAYNGGSWQQVKASTE